jgi:hypothetical protein
MIIFDAKKFRVEWDGTPKEPKQRMKVTLRYNEGVEGYRYLTPERGEMFMANLNAALLMLSEGPWMSKGEG